MKWTMKIQKLGRIQIPTSYLKAYGIKEGNIVIVEEEENKLIVGFKRKGKTKKMKWTMKIQKLGRIQIPTSYLKAYGIKEGNIVIVEEKGDKLILSFKRRRKS